MMSRLLSQLNDSLADVAAGALHSVVQVRDGARGVGAGAIWHADGLIITNAHVVRGASLRGASSSQMRRDGRQAQGGLEVALADGRVLPARVLALDDEHDLAALSIDAHDLPTIAPGSSRALHAGEWVFALGHPWGVNNAVTGGVVIRVGRGLPQLPGLQGDFVVTDLQLRPGNSGGPLVDAHGRMVGVNTLMNGPEVGVAVSVDAVKAFLRQALGSTTAARVQHNVPAGVV